MYQRMWVQFGKGNIINILKKYQTALYSAPPRYAEASLVKTMEELGIGSSSTCHQPYLQYLLEDMLKKRVKSCCRGLGYIINEILVEYFVEIINVNLQLIWKNNR